MDDLERRLRESMGRAVDSWSPIPGQVRRRTATVSRPRLRVTLAFAAVVVVLLGGIGAVTALTGAHHAAPASLSAATPPSAVATAPGCPGLQFLSESAYDAETPPPAACATPVPLCPQASPGASASAPATDYHPLTDTGQAYSSSICLTPDEPTAASVPGTVAPTAATAVTTPACTPAQLTASLTADAGSYDHGQTAHLTAAVTNTSAADCEAAIGNVADPVATDATGATVWTDCQATGDTEQPDGTCINDLAARAGSMLVPPGGQVADLSQVFTWDLGLTGSTARDPRPVPAGAYTVSWQGLSGAPPATVSITVTG